MVPVVISHLGLGGYGIWSIIMVTAGYMRFGVAGVKSAFQKYVAEATETENFDTAKVLLSTGSLALLGLSVLVLIPVTAFSTVIARASGVPAELLAATANSLSVLAFTYAVCNFGAVFEAIVMGGHRVDLVKKYIGVLAVCEAGAIVLLMHFGFGLLAMTIVIAVSELLYSALCYAAASRLLPEIKIGFQYFRKSAFPELIRFAGSYQLVNIFEVVGAAILPIAVLRCFGAASAGVLAVAGRIVAAALIGQEALVLPLLTGGAVVFASGSFERSRLFLAKSFKATLAAALLPLAFVCAFGATIIFAWIGETSPAFRMTIWLSALAGLFRAIALLQLIVYRAAGRALLDNLRQALRLAATLALALAGRRLGFAGVLAGVAAAELLGVVFMFFAVPSVFQGFSARALIADALRLSMATVAILAAGALVAWMPVSRGLADRVAAGIRLGEIALVCSMVAGPILIWTRCISNSERHTAMEALRMAAKSVAAA